MKPTQTVLAGLLPALAITFTLATAPAYADDPPADPAVDPAVDVPAEPDYDPIIAQSGVPNELPKSTGALHTESSHGDNGTGMIFSESNGIQPSLFGTNSPLRRWMQKHAAK